MKIYIPVFLLLFSSSCIQNAGSVAVTEKKLKKAMTDYLKATNKPGVIFTVKDVIFYEKQKEYTCEFKVAMKSPDRDTTGTMSAFVSKDFKKVTRTQ